MLGIGRNNITKINTLPDREAIDVNALEYFLKENKHQACIVIANAGTVNTGDFDDLVAINELKKQYNFWLHVDGAFGAFAIISENHKHLMKGINHADSITIDAHKWLNVPYDAAMQFSKHKNLQLKVFQNSAAYLGDPSESPDFFHYTPENSRRWRALPTWFTLMAYGRHGQSELVTRCCTLASSLGEQINSSQYFTLLSPVRLNIVCFTLAKENTTSKDIADFLQAIRDDGRAFFTPTVYKGIPAIRAAFSNWLTQKRDVEIAYQALEEVYIKMQHGKEK